MAVLERSLLTPKRWLELSPYLDQTLSIPKRERAVWLQSFREKNPELGELLKSLLDKHRVMAERKFIEKSLDIVLKPSGLSGRVIGAYPLISRIGQGGMGTVWLAERNDGRFER